MNNKKQDNIRNFCIIAHIDHGKSTLADRLIEITGTLTKREMEAQVLDNMELEKERGITIKSQAVRLIYTSPVDNEEYILNLIDTPGHVDFNYEVSRSLAACEGAILVVDASQGIQAQTLANCYLASDAGLEVVPVLNKVDLPSQRTEEVREEIEDIIGIEAQDAPAISAKTGLNIGDVLETIVRKIPKPRGNINAPLKALVFDSMYDSYRGVICYIRVKEGYIKPQMKIRFMFSNKEYEVTEVGIFTPSYKSIDLLQAGEVGYVTAAIKNVKDARVGDTITSIENPASEPLEGYKSAIPTVFSGIYPIVGDKYDELKEALEKLQLNDAALIFEPETSLALGFGFRCGFLGLLHMEIVQERLEREFNLDIIITAPSVIYKVNKTSGNIVEITNPYNMPKSTEVESTEEPIVNATIITPSEFVGGVMELCQGRRANFIDMQYLDTTRVILK
ncbi:GTP-binding protein lepA, partial [Candidatus Arthromitus sp. SFB-3]